jgi:hypothetical protein
MLQYEAQRQVLVEKQTKKMAYLEQRSQACPVILLQATSACLHAACQPANRMTAW